MAIRQTPINSGFGAKTQASEVMAGRDLSGKTAIVTGGYSGLGLETTKALADAGARVIVTARRPDVAREALLGLDEVEVQALDLAELASVRRFAEAFSASRRRADIVINNAGVMACPETRVGPGWEAQFATNHLGHYALVNLLWPSLADDARVVAVSSAGHHYSAIRWDDVQFERGYDKWLAYAQSKTANALFAIQLDALGRERGVRAFALHPGSIATPLQRHVPRAEMIALGWMDEAGNPASPDTLKTPQQGGCHPAMGCDLSAVGGDGRALLRGLRHRRRRAGRLAHPGRRTRACDRSGAGPPPLEAFGDAHRDRRIRVLVEHTEDVADTALSVHQTSTGIDRMTSSSVGKGIAISGMFFMLGLCFGSLSSRMATIKDGLQLSDGVFGSALFAMSAGVVLSLPVSGWMIAKLGSRNVGVMAILTNAVLLSLVPLASSVYQLAALLFVSGFSYSAVNVSNNTQASLSEALSGKTELPFFHGIWGLAGFVGAGFGALMIGQDFALSTHFGVISVIAFLAALACWRFLHDQPGAERVGRAFTMPDRRLFNYGLIVFFSMACEGIMYDWSVVYFQDVVSAERQLVGVGFMVFMGAMTVGRLLLNRVADRFGTRSTL